MGNVWDDVLRQIEKARAKLGAADSGDGMEGKMGQEEDTGNGHDKEHGGQGGTGQAFKSCDDFKHLDNCDCGFCTIMKKAPERRIIKTLSREKETIYELVLQWNDKITRELIYPGDPEYVEIAQEWENEQPL